MRKLVYILFLMICVACTDDTSFVVDSAKEPCTFSLSLQVPEMQESTSRSFTEIDASNYTKYPLHVVVFDGNGFFIEAKEAKPTKFQDGQAYFQVDLRPSQEKRILHFIINSPKKIEEYNYGTEVGLIAMGHLEVHDGVGAYWQRLEFPNGLSKKDPTTTSQLRGIPMLRNYAKITVENLSSEFELKDFVVMNVPDQGTVAPYLMNKEGGNFATFHTMDSSNKPVLKTYKKLLAEGYEGFESSDMTFLNTDAKVAFNEAIAADGSFHMYERRNKYFGDKHPTTFVVARGKYRGETCYYKIDFVYPSENGSLNYYNILRGFHYKVVIKTVNAKGKPTAADAAKHPAGNNLSAAVEINDLISLADGRNILRVSLTDTTVVNEGKIQLRYKYSNIKDGTNLNDQVQVARLLPLGSKKCIDSFNIRPNEENGWKVVDLNIVNVPKDNSIVTNVMRFYVTQTIGEGSDKKEIEYLSRVSEIHVRKPMDMLLECVPGYLPQGKNEEMKVNILIPKETASREDPFQLFPLVFYLEAEKNTIYPDVSTNTTTIKGSPTSLPVKVQPSIFKTNAGKSAIGYMRTLVLNEFIQAEERKVKLVDGFERTFKVIPACFKTNAVASASSVKCQNKYFTLRGKAFFTNTPIVSDVKITDGAYYGKNKPVNITFKALKAGNYMVSSSSLVFKSPVMNLNQNATGTIDAKTSTWGSKSDVEINYNDVTIRHEGGVRNKLAMKVQSLLFNAQEVTENVALRVYADEAAAKKFSKGKVLTEMDAATLKNTGVELVQADLKEDTPLWFAYRYNTNKKIIYYASATAGDLAAGTAVLNFTQITRKITMSGTFDNDIYYGTTKEATFNFVTDTPGTYKISNTNTSLDNHSVEFKETDVDANGQYSMALTFTQTTWDAKAYLTVTDPDGGTTPRIESKSVRNTLAFWVDSNSTSAPNRSSTSVAMKKPDGTQITNQKWEDWYSNKGQQIIIEGLKENDDITFTYTISLGFLNITYNASISSEDLAKSTQEAPAKLNFKY